MSPGANQNTFQPSHLSETDFPALPSFSVNKHICVIGAGAFGGWAALSLQRQGYTVTLVDSWGPGNSRSSSGDETRVIRSTYGNSELYFNLNVRSLELWKEYQASFRRKIFFNSGVLWFCYQEHNPLVDDSIPFSKRHKMEYERLSTSDLQKRYPIVNTQDLHHAFLDPWGGYLKARESCDEVAMLFIDRGGIYEQGKVETPSIDGAGLNTITLSNGKTVRADAFLFACGSWLPFLFPEYLAPHISCTKQAVFYFGTPANHAAQFDQMPAWIDLDGTDFYYGIAGNAFRGFKIGVDKRGPLFNPETGERTIDLNVLNDARAFLAHRFPDLSNAPLLESRICPYENSSTGNFIFDKHPNAENVFFLGGGSGHGFKHGPALGELVSHVIAGTKKTPAPFRIFR